MQTKGTGVLVGFGTPVFLQGSENWKVAIAASWVGLAAEQRLPSLCRSSLPGSRVVNVSFHISGLA